MCIYSLRRNRTSLSLRPCTALLRSCISEWSLIPLRLRWRSPWRGLRSSRSVFQKQLFFIFFDFFVLFPFCFFNYCPARSSSRCSCRLSRRLTIDNPGYRLVRGDDRPAAAAVRFSLDDWRISKKRVRKHRC